MVYWGSQGEVLEKYVRVWLGTHSAEFLGLAFAFLAAAAVFIFDLTFPLGVAGAVPYVLVILICSWQARCPVFLAAAACSVLTILGYFLSPAGGEPTVVLINRALALFAIWVTALLVNERTRVEKSLASAEGSLSSKTARFSEFIRSSNDWFWEMDEDLRYTYVSQGIHKGRKQKPDDYLGRTHSEALAGYANDKTQREFAALLEQRKRVHDMYLRRSQPGGKHQWACVSAWPIYDPQGRFIGYRGIATDLTEGVYLKEVIHREEKRFSDVLAAVHEVVWETDAEGKYSFLSDNVKEVFGVEPSGVLNRHPLEFVPKNNTEIMRLQFANAFTAGKKFDNYEYEVVGPRGEEVWISTSGAPHHGENGEFLGFLGTARNITRRKKIEIALQGSQERFAGILNIAPEAIISLDADQRIRLFNSGAERIFGHAASDVIGKPVEILIPPRYRNVHRNHVMLFQAADKESTLMSDRGEISGLRADGSEFPAKASISRLNLDDEVVLTVILHDITEQKMVEADLIEAKEEAELANRAKSEFLSNMSHELRTPLNAIIGFAEIMKQRTFGPLGHANYEDYAASILESGQQLLSLIGDILTLSTGSSGMTKINDELIDIGDLVKTALARIRDEAEEKQIEIGTTLAANQVMRLKADEYMLNKMLGSLLSNAVKFTPSGGRVLLAAGIDENGRLRLSVSDNGIGISDANLQKALAEFGQVESSYRRKYSGAGLGLPLVKLFAKLHGGGIEILTELNQGTTVTIWFPRERIVSSSV